MIVFLVGFMGAGKSTVGPRLARSVGTIFVDVDDVIEAQGVPIAQLFAQEGEEVFRDREQKALQTACSGGDAVVGTGGGVVIRDANRELMRSSGTVVYLAAPIDVLWARVSGSDRPLATDRPRFDDLFASREPLYRSVAHHTIDATLPVEQVVEATTEALGV